VIAGQPSSIPALSVGFLAPSLIGDHSLKIPEPQKLIMPTREGWDRIATPRGDTSRPFAFTAFPSADISKEWLVVIMVRR
jgi:hypothetical protein